MTTTTITTIAGTGRRRDLTRVCMAVGLLCLLAVTLASGLASREGNQYITYGTLWASGRAAIHGVNPYAGYPETYRTDYSRYGIPGKIPDLNLNPPWTLPLVQGLSHLSLRRFAQIWTLLTGVCFLAGCIVLIVRQPELQGRQVLWLSLCAPTVITLMSGQVYGWAFLTGVLAWMFSRDGRLIAAGAAIGIVVSLRPTMGLVLLILFLANHRKVVAVAAGTIVALNAAPLAIYGPGIYVEWVRAFAGDKHWVDPLNIAIMPLLARHGLPHLGSVIAVLVVLAVCWWAVKTKPDFTNACGAGLCLGILCAPLAWFHYILFAAPFFMTRRWSALSTIGASLLLVITLFSEATRGLLYLAATVVILYFFVFYEHRRRDSDARPVG